MKNKGFTLVEVLIGLFIAVTASTYVAQTIASTNKVVDSGKDTFIAVNLAHEGVDLTRAIRDNTWFLDATPLDRREWMSQSGICADEPDEEEHLYVIDIEKVEDFMEHPDSIRVEQGGRLGKFLYIQPDTNIWTHKKSLGSKQSDYTRSLEADCSNVEEFVTITSTVFWKDAKGRTKQVSIKERLYNWL